MRVLVSTADSGSVKEVSFSKFVDTSSKESEAPHIEVLLPHVGNGPKKGSAVTHLAVNGENVAVSRKSGTIHLNEKELAHLGDCIGLFWGPTGGEHAGILFAYGSDGKALAINTATGKQYNFQLRDGLSCVANLPDTLTFASAGSEPLPNVFELAITNDKVEVDIKWEASQPPNNILDLPESNDVSCMVFTDKQTLVATTGKGSLRTYALADENHQPQNLITASQWGTKSLAVDPTKPGVVICGDSRTTVSRWSTTPPKLLGHYKGVNGSTRAISCRGKYVAMGGLDRYLRVYDIEKRQPAGKVYLGEEIWDLVLVKQDEEEDIDDADSLWNDLGLSNKRMRKSDAEDDVDEADHATSEEGSEDESSESDASEASYEESATEYSDDSFAGFD